MAPTSHAPPGSEPIGGDDREALHTSVAANSATSGLRVAVVLRILGAMLMRHGHGSPGAARVRVAGALGALVLTWTTHADADGERSPMLGGAVVGTHAGQHDAELVGVELEAAWWRGWLGFALEGSTHWDVDPQGGRRATVLGASARVRLFDCLLPSLVEPRDVELGLELHGIVEHGWWDHDDSTGYGVGLALRLRGGGDDDFSVLLAESRLFVRVVSSRWSAVEAIARSATPVEDPGTRELTILVGLGASFGAGERGYLERFRRRPFDSVILL